MKELRIDIWAVWFSKWKSKTYHTYRSTQAKSQNHSGAHK